MCRRAIRFGTPIALLLLGFALLIGCIPISETPTRTEGSNAADFVGDKATTKPIRPGAITRAQVLALVGKPFVTLPDEHASLVYEWTEYIGRYLFCSPRWPSEGPERYRTRQLILSFDANDVLTGYRIQTVGD